MIPASVQLIRTRSVPAPSRPDLGLHREVPLGMVDVPDVGDRGNCRMSRSRAREAERSGSMSADDGLITTIAVRRRARVSLTMIACDAEAGLDECLRSADDLFDEIIVVDTGSTDRTVDVARAHGARTFDFVWVDDFAAARNAALRVSEATMHSGLMPTTVSTHLGASGSRSCSTAWRPAPRRPTPCAVSPRGAALRLTRSA